MKTITQKELDDIRARCAAAEAERDVLALELTRVWKVANDYVNDHRAESLLTEDVHAWLDWARRKVASVYDTSNEFEPPTLAVLMNIKNDLH